MARGANDLRSVQFANENRIEENLEFSLSEFLKYLIESPCCKKTKETNIGENILHMMK